MYLKKFVHLSRWNTMENFAKEIGPESVLPWLYLEISRLVIVLYSGHHAVWVGSLSWAHRHRSLHISVTGDEVRVRSKQRWNQHDVRWWWWQFWIVDHDNHSNNSSVNKLILEANFVIRRPSIMPNECVLTWTWQKQHSSESINCAISIDKTCSISFPIGSPYMVSWCINDKHWLN